MIKIKRDKSGALILPPRTPRRTGYRYIDTIVSRDRQGRETGRTVIWEDLTRKPLPVRMEE